MEKSVDDITGVVVSYNDSDLILRSVGSIKKHYPTMKIIIVEGSPPNSPCITTSKKIALENFGVETHVMKKNIGHGLGMHYGISRAATDFVLVFDSDIELLKPCLEDMMHHMVGISFLGTMMHIDTDGECTENGCPYIHPSFALIDKREYVKYKPFVHHGAPCIHTMFDIYNKGLGDDILADYPVDDYVYHEWAGTRRKSPPEFLRSWANYRE